MAVMGAGLTQVSRQAGSRFRYLAPLEVDAIGDCCRERGGTESQNSQVRYDSITYNRLASWTWWMESAT
jgi:hypothetical protein